MSPDDTPCWLRTASTPTARPVAQRALARTGSGSGGSGTPTRVPYKPALRGAALPRPLSAPLSAPPAPLAQFPRPPRPPASSISDRPLASLQQAGALCDALDALAAHGGAAPLVLLSVGSERWSLPECLLVLSERGWMQDQITPATAPPPPNRQQTEGKREGALPSAHRCSSATRLLRLRRGSWPSLAEPAASVAAGGGSVRLQSAVGTAARTRAVQGAPDMQPEHTAVGGVRAV